MMDNFVQGLYSFSPKPGITVVVDERKGTGTVDLFAGLKGGIWDRAAQNPALPYLFSEVLEEGTKSMNRDDIRHTIENVGSDLSFEILGEYVLAKLRATKSGFPSSFRVLADIFTNPTFPEESVAVTKKRLMNECREENEDTRKRAQAGLSALLFEEHSAHFLHPPSERLKRLGKISQEDLVSYASLALTHPLLIAVVGDVSPRNVEKLCRDSFSEHKTGSGERALLPVRLKKSAPQDSFITVPGKENVDVFLGRYTGVPVSHDDFVPLSVAVEMLGGSGFTGHLMQTVRERDGLTYGIYARLKDVSGELPLFAFVWATFGNMLFERGTKATKDEMRKWLETGATEQLLERKKTEIIGSYVVSLEDPERVSFKLLSLLGSGRPLSFLKEYPEAVSRLTLAGVEDAARKHLDPKDFKLAAAGSIDKNGKPL